MYRDRILSPSCAEQKRFLVL
ncbi:hypothetical protein EI555_015890 [Monodon monoceros]|uniref:Uncharacterized protein n=1 Tax=Monodon monoceros TaxID=40151 RepID=A0A4V5P9Z4_MONMO|nr:hypothetical protein EI555_015890 [Monodon monoceros]